MFDPTLETRFPICIVGVGARTPLGLTAAASAAAVRAAISAVCQHAFLVDRSGEPMSVAADAQLGLETAGVERLCALVLPAIAEALAPLEEAGALNAPLPLILGLPEQRPGLPPGFANAVADQLRKSDRRLAKALPLAFGHAAGLMALEEAAKALQTNQAHFVLAGGVDSYLDADTLDWLDDQRQLLSDRNRAGFAPGEGAGVCLLTTARMARQCRLQVFAHLASAATATESKKIKSDDVCIGEGLTDAIRKAVSVLRLPEERIDFTYCDMNGERYRSEEYTFAILRTQKAFVDGNDFLTPADCWGDVGAASGPLHGVLAVESARRHYARGPRTLLWAGSEGGQRSAAVLHLPLASAGGR